VGEVNVALPLLRRLREIRPDVPVLLTASTPTGVALARERTETPVAWYPLDHPLCVRGFFGRVRPRALVLIETELWPNALARAQAQGVPVALVNGRLSDASAVWYRRFAALWRPGVRGLAVAGMQTEAYAARLIALGAPADRVRVTGNIKYDAAPEPVGPDERRALRASLRIPADAPVLVFGSTRPGDEALLASCLPELSSAFPELRIIVAPRHLDRIAEAELALNTWPSVRRSVLDREPAAPAAGIVMLDTHGELSRLYSIATVAVVGGSLTGDVGGHNPIEPAAHGVPIVIGPDMSNFADAAAELLNSGGAVQTRSEDLGKSVIGLLRDRALRETIGVRAKDAVDRNRGALGRTIELVLPLLGR
jgi:3-deoxy-D-manno-octulosonic-acid transferase